jgi:aryl-alcohol dehydrogenase-like predicted oxidoreductase
VDYKKLGSSNLEFSKLCYGTMMMGSQNDASSSEKILCAAFDSGINFFDTAEMYSVPPDPKTQGNSENILDDWIKKKAIARKSYSPLK